MFSICSRSNGAVVEPAGISINSSYFRTLLSFKNLNSVIKSRFTEFSNLNKNSALFKSSCTKVPSKKFRLVVSETVNSCSPVIGLK